MRPLSPYGRFGDLTILVGDCALYGPLTRLLEERAIGVLHIAKLQDLPDARAGGVARVAVVCSADIANAADKLSQQSKTQNGAPVLIQLDGNCDVLATVEQEICEQDEWREELPSLIQSAQSMCAGAADE